MADDFLTAKIHSLNEFFVLFSTATKSPFISCNKETFDDEIFVYANADDARARAQALGELGYPLAVIKIVKAQSANFLTSLYFYGINVVDFYTGEERNPIPIEHLCTRPDLEALKNDKVPKANPDVQLTAGYFIQEVRRRIENKTKDDLVRLKEMEEEMAVNLFRSRFIVAIDTTNETQKFDITDKTRKYKLVTVTAKNGEMYMPCFSDLSEFRKFSAANRKGKFQLLPIPFNKLKDFCKSANGVVINPSGFNLLLKNDAFERLERMYG